MEFSKLILILLSSVKFSSQSCPTLRSHGLQHDRPPYPSPTPGACSNSCPSSQWCHPTILSSVVSSFTRLQTFTASEAFQMSQFFTSDGRSIWVSASASVLPMNIQDWFPLGLTSLILKSKRLSRFFSQQFSSKASLLQCPAFFMVQLSHLYMTTEKTIALTVQTFVGKIMSLLFNTLFKFAVCIFWI